MYSNQVHQFLISIFSVFFTDNRLIDTQTDATKCQRQYLLHAAYSWHTHSKTN